MVWRNVPLCHLLKCLLPLCHALFVEKDKVLEAVLQGHVASDYGWLVSLSRPGRSGGDEPGVETIRGCVHERCALNTRLSFGTSVGTTEVKRARNKNRNEAGTKIEPDTYCVPVEKEGWKIDPHVSNLRSHVFSFQGVQGFRSTLNWPILYHEAHHINWGR